MVERTVRGMIRMNHNVGLKCLCHLPKRLFVIINMHSYFSYISQGSVEMHLRGGGIYDYHIIANCPQSVPVKEFRKSVNIGEDMDKSKVLCFYGPPCIPIILGGSVVK